MHTSGHDLDPPTAPFPDPSDVDRLVRHALQIGRLAYFERNVRTDEAQWNLHMYRLFGLPPDGPAPSFAEVMRRLHPADRAHSLQAWQHSIDTCEPGESFYRLVHPDGRIMAVHMVWDVTRGEDGRALKICGLALDSSAAEAVHTQVDELSQHLALASALSRMGTWRHELASDQLFWDQPMCEMLGYTAPMPPMSLEAAREFIHPDDRERIRAAAARVVDQPGPLTQEFRMRRRDGTYAPVASRRVLHTDADGKPVRVTGVMLDLSKEHEARRQRQTLLELLELMTGVTGVGLFHYDLGTHAAHWSAEAYRLWGFEGRSTPPRLDEVYAHIHPDDVPRVQAAREQAEREPGVVELEYRVLRPDGGHRHLLTRRTVLRDAGGRASALVGVAMDVTPQREAALQQQALLKRLQLATSITGMGLWEYDPRDHSLIWNEGMFRLFGQAPDLAAGADPRRLWQRATGQSGAGPVMSLDTFLHDLVGASGLHESEWSLPCGDGATRWIAVRSAVQRNEAGQAERVLGVAWDVTSQRIAEHERSERMAAQRASLAKSEFLSRMSHELRTPLNAILGFAQVLRSDIRQPLLEGQRQHVEQIESAGWHLLNLINEVLELSSIEAGALRMVPQDVALAPMVRDVCALVATEAERMGITLDASGVAPQLHVRADPTRLKQVLLNLASNAIKYNQPGGSVTISSTSSTAPPGEAGRTVRIDVTDTGMGMNPDQRQRLFQPFDRLGREGGTVQGTGIGLVISRRLTELMGGRLEVESEAGIGSRFSVLLAGASEPGAAAASPGKDAGPAPAGGEVRGRVLYIEDNDVNALLVREYLAMLPGVTLETALTGLGGVVLASQCAPDLILVDLNLPDITGYEVLGRLRELPALARVPCVAVTAAALDEDRQAALDAGFDACWTKPLSLRDFLGGVRQYLETRTAAVT